MSHIAGGTSSRLYTKKEWLINECHCRCEAISTNSSNSNLGNQAWAESHVENCQNKQSSKKTMVLQPHLSFIQHRICSTLLVWTHQTKTENKNRRKLFSLTMFHSQRPCTSIISHIFPWLGSSSSLSRPTACMLCSRTVGNRLHWHQSEKPLPAYLPSQVKSTARDRFENDEFGRLPYRGFAMIFITGEQIFLIKPKWAAGKQSGFSKTQHLNDPDLVKFKNTISNPRPKSTMFQPLKILKHNFYRPKIIETAFFEDISPYVPGTQWSNPWVHSAQWESLLEQRPTLPSPIVGSCCCSG